MTYQNDNPENEQPVKPLKDQPHEGGIAYIVGEGEPELFFLNPERSIIGPTATKDLLKSLLRDGDVATDSADESDNEG